MKKYETPVLEIIQLADFCEYIDYSLGNDADAKQLDTELIEDSELWNTDSWEINYSLWDEE